MLVVAVPVQVVCWVQRPVQETAEPQTLGLAAPQVAPPVQVPQLGMTLPQPSVAEPQLKPCEAQVLGAQVTLPQTPV